MGYTSLVHLFHLVICILAGVMPAFSQSGSRLPTRFRLPNELREVSGLYIAGKDSLWWHNDGDHSPALFLTNSKGGLIKRWDLPGLQNKDWEDITADDAGRIYIGDFGNNTNTRKDLRIYILCPGKPLDSISFRYPDQTAFPPPASAAAFDMEAFFWHRDSLHLFSKNRLQKGNYYTKHYVLPAGPGNYTALLRDSLYLRNRVVTAAAISPEGQKIALVAYHFKRFLGIFPTSSASVFWLDGFHGNHFLKGNLHRIRLSFLWATQYESLDFETNDQVIVASERTLFIPQKAKRVILKAK